jgi:hypothetical protein
VGVELKEIADFLCRELASITGRPVESFGEHSALIGARTEVSSRGFVELLLAAEDFASERLGFAFDWASDAAMSEARSHFRTVGSLAHHLLDSSRGPSAL